MDREQMGKIISECRRELGLTQQELAEQLHVTNKAVSKWERGLKLSGCDAATLGVGSGTAGRGTDGLPSAGRRTARGGPGENLLTISRGLPGGSGGAPGDLLAGVLAFGNDRGPAGGLPSPVCDGGPAGGDHPEGDLWTGPTTLIWRRRAICCSCGGDVDFDDRSG